MPSVSATLRHLGAQGLDDRVLREALRQTTGDDGHGDERVRSSPRAVPAAETSKSVSFSDVDRYRNTTPEFVGTRSSRYDIRARRRAAERRKQRLKEQPAAAAATAGGLRADTAWTCILAKGRYMHGTVRYMHVGQKPNGCGNRRLSKAYK